MLNTKYNEGMWKGNIKSQHSPHRQELRRSKNERELLGHQVTFTSITEDNQE